MQQQQQQVRKTASPVAVQAYCVLHKAPWPKKPSKQLLFCCF